MQKPLNKNKIDYVLFHLAQHLDGLEEIRPYFEYSDNTENNIEKKGKIVFLLSEKEVQDNPPFLLNGIPVLFPVKDNAEVYTFDGDSLVFNHDFLKSAFYLLSGYQEQTSTDVDTFGRFPYESSVQNKLNATAIPLVNYYFDFIAGGLEKFAEKHRLKLVRKKLFKDFGFVLSHDVDKIDYFHWRDTAYRWMQVLGLRKAHYNRKRLFRAAVDSIIPTVFPGDNDPFWSFERMCKAESKLNIVSSFYFLNRDGSSFDARYFFSEKRIKDVMSFIRRKGCEVGLHGSFRTAEDEKAMMNAVSELRNAYSYKVTGIRQHFLKFSYPRTFYIQQKAGFRYDTTLGFAPHEGFRNGYCYPFKPYDIKEDKMIDIWEFPLNVMDATLFYYRKLDFDRAGIAIMTVISEVKKFGGVFSLLWHNSMFDEYEIPGITMFYENILAEVMAQGAKSLTGEMLLNKIEDEM
ncbi:MAG: hypothetical protein GXO47_05135 [Chlorobi bacterium]|nr:hypothetical protein [Chlorobiota bacterium]